VRDGGREREREREREEGRERERERSHESGIKSRREQTVPKYQRPRNKRRRPDVLARCLSLFLSLSLSCSFPVAFLSARSLCLLSPRSNGRARNRRFFHLVRDLCRPIVDRERGGEGADKERKRETERRGGRQKPRRRNSRAESDATKRTKRLVFLSPRSGAAAAGGMSHLSLNGRDRIERASRDRSIAARRESSADAVKGDYGCLVADDAIYHSCRHRGYQPCR